MLPHNKRFNHRHRHHHCQSHCHPECHRHCLHSPQPVLELGLPGEGSTGLNLLADKQGVITDNQDVITDNQGVITDNCRYLRNV